VELKDLQAGDEVFLSYGNFDYIKCRVEKITPSGLIKVNNKLFYPGGSERTKGYYGDHILAINDKSIEKVRSMKHNLAIKNMKIKLRDYDYKKLPDDLIIQIHDQIKEWEESQKNALDSGGG